jgi:hypothetical protein
MATKKTAKPATKTPARPRRPRDVNQFAHALINEMTERNEDKPSPVSPEISQYMATLGRKGGLKGGNSRMAMLTEEQRSDLASKAAHALWAKRRAKN